MRRAISLFAWFAVFLAVSLFSQSIKAELLDDLLSPDRVTREKALVLLDSSADKKEKIIIQLIEKSFNNNGTQEDYALQDLKTIGSSAIAPSIRIIDDVTLSEKDPWVSICLSAGKEAIPELKKFLGKDRLHAAAAACLMLKVDAENGEAAAFISKTLKASSEEKMTMFCLRALSSAAKPSEAEIQTVVARLENPGNLREAALYCLDKFGSHASAAAPQVLKVLTTETTEGRILPLKVLGNLGEAAYEALPFLCELASKDDIVLRLSVLRVIGEIGVDPARALPVLEVSLKHEDEFVRAAAAEAVGRFDKKAYRSVPALSEALMSSRLNYTQDKIIKALRAIGTDEALAAVDKFRKEVRQKKK